MGWRMEIANRYAMGEDITRQKAPMAQDKGKANTESSGQKGHPNRNNNRN